MNWDLDNCIGGLFAPHPIPINHIMAEMQNSNPTILNVADLPTRSRSTVKASDPTGIFAAVPNPADFLSSDSEDDDLLEEPIDEQEIYGKDHHVLTIAMGLWLICSFLLIFQT